MPTSVHVGETARDRTDFCRCFKTGAAVLLHNDWIVAHSTYRNTPSEPCAPARTRYDTRPRALIGKTVRSGQTETNSVRAQAAEIASAACQSARNFCPLSASRFWRFRTPAFAVYV